MPLSDTFSNVTCEACRQRLESVPTNEHNFPLPQSVFDVGNPGRVEMGHQFYHTRGGPIALCMARLLSEAKPPKPTLRDLIIAAKCRQGESSGITKKGAYWTADVIKIRAYGGDGIGQSTADRWVYLELRHYRRGDVAAVVEWGGKHQNYAVQTHRETSEDILDATTCEEVIAALRGMSYEGDHALSSYCEDNLIASLKTLGLPEADPAPDEEPAAQ